MISQLGADPWARQSGVQRLGLGVHYDAHIPTSRACLIRSWTLFHEEGLLHFS